jgi:Serine/threonine protein phosphatase
MKQNTDSNYNFCLVGTTTSVGKIRKANEDSMDVFETANMKVFVVCDGMGGHVGGQVASQTAITTIRDFLVNNITIDPCEAIHNAIMAANEAVLARSRQQPELAGMGSTCVMLVVTSDGKVYYGHVGDSRIYIIANRRITQLTKDHSFVQMLVDAGRITKEEAEHHPRKNEITNALGLPDMQAPAVSNTPIEPEAGNCFLLCSDGLTGMVDDIHIERVVSNRNLKIQDRAEKLVQMANNNGGIDNITVQLVEFAVGMQDIYQSGVTKKYWKKTLYLLPLVLLLVGMIWWFWPKLSSEKKISTGEMNDTSRVMPSGINPALVMKKDTTISFLRKEPYVLRTNEKIRVKIFENDTILENTVEIINLPQFIEGSANGNHIDLLLKKENINETTLEIKCETKLYKCHLFIPIKIDKKTTDTKPVVEEFQLPDIVLNQDKDADITVPSEHRIIKLTSITDSVICDPKSGEENTYVIRCQKEATDSPFKIILKGTNKEGREYRYRINVKSPKEENLRKKKESTTTLLI